MTRPPDQETSRPDHRRERRIGEAMARRFAAGGFRIVAGRKADRLDQLAGELSSLTSIEVGRRRQRQGRTQRAVDLAMSRFGRLDCLVNNAGAGRWAPVDQTDDAMLDEVIEISLKAPFRFCRAAIPVMRPGSSIVTVGSDLRRNASAWMAASTAQSRRGWSA